MDIIEPQNTLIIRSGHPPADQRKSILQESVTELRHFHSVNISLFYNLLSDYKTYVYTTQVG